MQYCGVGGDTRSGEDWGDGAVFVLFLLVAVVGDRFVCVGGDG